MALLQRSHNVPATLLGCNFLCLGTLTSKNRLLVRQEREKEASWCTEKGKEKKREKQEETKERSKRRYGAAHDEANRAVNYRANIRVNKKRKQRSK